MMFLFMNNMVIIVDSDLIWHLKRTQIKIHVSISNWDCFEGFNCRFKWLDRNADFSFSILIPAAFQKFDILAGSFLYF